ncbi:DNA-binding transcriptional MerR regulator [Arthrobacter woluwensis]|uniref:MerR family transcriptional regulator n=1 Tax=Arthrobacter woluwensis TaxID=156980 RepID=UPI00278A1659|nr:MerR family transcriptional regulator [Arthrobacter woluwensis]MDQ0707465.1 DNA-binding transcriptional MerR regulator [Arthrobacter woluwensis]
MLSIGEIAHSTGVSRRMLRHWENEGLLAPAVVDPATGYRRYQDSQLGRVRAIAELRTLGFGLAEIGQLLDPRLGRTTLESLLTHQEDALQQQITEASARLVHVRRRLDIIRSESQEIAMNLTLTALPAVEFWGLSTTVLDETEIGHAVHDLRRRLPWAGDELVLLYDGTSDDRITVSAGTIVRPESEVAGKIVAQEAAAGVSVDFDVLPENIADAWVLIETELDKRRLASFGVYRQIHGSNGGVTLQAPIRERH